MRANQLARHLRTLGVGPDTQVAICARRGIHMVVAMLAVLKAGGAYVPMDPAYPAERLAHVLRDSEPLALLVDEQTPWQGPLRDALPASTPVVHLLAEEALWAGQSGTDIASDELGLKPSHLAYEIGRAHV